MIMLSWFKKICLKCIKEQRLSLSFSFVWLEHEKKCFIFHEQVSKQHYNLLAFLGKIHLWKWVSLRNDADVQVFSFFRAAPRIQEITSKTMYSSKKKEKERRWKPLLNLELVFWVNFYHISRKKSYIYHSRKASDCSSSRQRKWKVINKNWKADRIVVLAAQ